MACILQPSGFNSKLLNPLTGNYESVLDLVGFGAFEVNMTMVHDGVIFTYNK
jgi:hypothetical protein